MCTSFQFYLEILDYNTLKMYCKVQNVILKWSILPSFLFWNFAKCLACWDINPWKIYFRRSCLFKYLDHVLFFFWELTYALGAIIPVDKKTQCERLFGTIYLKIVHSISNKSVLKIRRNKFAGENFKQIKA